jgi:hypothetical protein
MRSNWGSIKWRAILSLLKLLAEGSPAKQQIMIGGIINSRRMLLAFPDDKYKHEAWSEAITKILSSRSGTQDKLETLLVGLLLNHAAYIIPMVARHFTAGIRGLVRSKQNGGRRVQLIDDATTPYTYGPHWKNKLPS